MEENTSFSVMDMKSKLPTETSTESVAEICREDLFKQGRELYNCCCDMQWTEVTSRFLSVVRTHQQPIHPIHPIQIHHSHLHPIPLPLPLLIIFLPYAELPLIVTDAPVGLSTILIFKSTARVSDWL